MTTCALEGTHLILMPRRNQKATRSAFATWLVGARNARGWSQDQAGEAIDRTQEFISQLERDVRRPSRETVLRLVKALALPDADEQTREALLNAGLDAAGFASKHDRRPDALSPTREQQHRYWELLGARTYWGPDSDEEDFALPENIEEWPDDLREALQEALFYTRIIPPEFLRTVVQLWRDQARAHAGVVVNRRVMQEHLKEIADKLPEPEQIKEPEGGAREAKEKEDE